MKDYLGDTAFFEDLWAESSTEAEGMDSAPLLDALADIESRDIGVHSLLVVRNGRCVLERYGVEEGRQLTPADLRILHSTTKTMTSMLVGIAVGEGRIPSLQSRAADYFEAGEVADRSPAKDRITLEDLLTMRSGLDYSEGVTDNSKAFASECAARVILSRRMVAEPGTQWNYSTADSQILAEIVRRATGKTPLEYATERILAPLGIREVRWSADRGGTNVGGSRLYLRPRDLARFGWMLLSGGRAGDEQLVPETWIETATRQHVLATTGYVVDEGYGYHCWMPSFGGFATRGYMGQNMYVLPDLKLVVVFTGLLKPSETADTTLDRLMSSFILPAVRSA